MRASNGSSSTNETPEGWVNHQGEDGMEVLDAPASVAGPGTALRIVSVEGLHLYVQPVGDIPSKSSPR